MKNAPPKIYLQIAGDSDADDFNQIDDKSITWCEDRCFPNDVEYFSKEEVEGMILSVLARYADTFTDETIKQFLK